MMNFTSNLQRLMQLHGNLSVSDLAKASTVPQPTLHHILSGMTKRPRMALLEKLAAFFGVSIEQLLGEQPCPMVIPIPLKNDLNLHSVPLIHEQMLKEWPDALSSKSFPELFLDKALGEHSFALTLSRGMVEPLFPENSILIFDAAKAPSHRDYVLFRLKKPEGIVFKRFFLEDKQAYLKDNLEDGNITLLKIEELSQVIGVLVEVRLQF